MPKLPGIDHQHAVRALEKAGFRIVRQGKHIVMSDGVHILLFPGITQSMRSPWAGLCGTLG